jgi:hypothetical protein
MSSCWDIVRIKVEQLIIKDSGVARHTRPLRTIASFPSAIHLRPAVCTVRKIMTCHLLEPTKSSLYVVVSFRALHDRTVAEGSSVLHSLVSGRYWLLQANNTGVMAASQGITASTCFEYLLSRPFKLTAVAT